MPSKQADIYAFGMAVYKVITGAPFTWTTQDTGALATDYWGPQAKQARRPAGYLV